MSEWRERGYVPDSDDEEDFEARLSLSVQHEEQSQQPSSEVELNRPAFIDQEVTNDSLPVKSQSSESRSQSTWHRVVVEIPAKSAGISHADKDGATKESEDVDGRPWSDCPDTTAEHNPSTLELLQQQLRKGLETCSQILRPTSPIADLSDTDSPLSSPPSSPEGLDRASQETRTVQRNLTPVHPHPDPRFFAPARTFRPRTSIQNNPYTLEYAKYQQQCRQRGLAPMRPESFRPGQTQGETQVTHAQGSSQQASSSPVHLSAVNERASDEEESQSPVRGFRSSEHIGAPSDEEELPDITDILRGAVSPTHRQQIMHKPRNKRSFIPDFDRRASFRVPSLSPGFDVGDNTDTGDVPIFDLPLSPPRSDGLDFPSVGRAAVPEIGVSTTPRPLLTPVLSSDRQPTKRSIIEVSSSSETESERLASQRSQSPSDESQRYVSVRRRIKGVLPASWLRLDAKQQTKKVDPRSHASPMKVSPVKGLATRITSTAHRNTQRLVLSDDDSDTTDSSARNGQSHPEVPQDLFDEDDDFTMYDVFEDDAVDAMLPSRSRGLTRYVPTRKRQQRLDDSWVGAQSRRALVPRSNVSHGSTRIREQHHRQSRPRKKTRLLSGPRAIAVTDAPDLQPGNGTRAPKYLRVAARTERQTYANNRRPIQKFLQLATQQDTRDVNNQMATLQLADRRPRARMQQRKRRANEASRRGGETWMALEVDPAPIQRLRNGAFDDDLRKLKQSSWKTLNRLHAAMPSDSVDFGISERPAEEAAEPPTFTRQSLAHKNRSGRGAFWNSLMTRPAALETLELASRPSAMTRLVQQDTRARHKSPDTVSQQLPSFALGPRGLRRKRVPRKTILTGVDDEVIATQDTASEAAATARVDAGKNASIGDEEQALMLILRSIGARCGTEDAFDPHHDRVAADWAALSSALTRFLRQTTIDPHNLDLRQRLGFEAIRSCVEVYTNCLWSDDDSILQVLFQRYSENNMLELFVAPNMGSKRMLGQRLSGYLTSESSKTDFDFFLELIAATLQKKTEAANNGAGTAKSLKRLRTLVSCLSPNNGRNLSHDQVLDLEDFVSMANTYSLYTILFTHVPSSCQPRLSQIHQLIDFTSCHWAICELALKAWVDITIHSVESAGDVADIQCLASWMQNTVLQMYEKLNTIPRTNEERHWPHVASVDLQNRSSTIGQIAQILDRWSEALARCSLASAHSILLKGDGLHKMIKLCQSDAADEDAIVCRIMHAIEMYCSRSDITSTEETRASAFKFVRDVLSFTVSASAPASSNRLRAVTETWFALAEISVAQQQKNWDDFLTPTSSNSFYMLSDSETSRQCHALFMSLIFDADAVYFDLDREPFYKTWICGIVIPQEDLLFEHELTQRIMTHDAEVFPMHGVHEVLDGQSGQLTLEGFKAARLNVVKYIVQCIYVLQFGGKEHSQDFMEQAMDIDQGRRLLQLMTATMKTRWQTSSADQRANYEPFVAEVIEHLQIYQYQGFDIDRWFTDPSLDGFPVNTLPLKHMFLRPAGRAPQGIDQDMICSFRKKCMRVAADNTDALYAELTAALSAHDDDIFDLEGNLLVETAMQLDFMGRVLSVYLEVFWNDSRHTPLFETILSTLISAFEGYHLRVGADEPESMSHFLHASHELITLVTDTAWKGISSSEQPSSLEQVPGIARLLRLATLVIQRAFQMLTWLDKDNRVNDAIEDITGCAHALNDWITRSTGIESGELACPFFASDDVEAEQDKAAVRSDLMKHLLESGPSPSGWPLQDAGAYEEAVASFQAALYETGLLEGEPTSLTSLVADSVGNFISDAY